MTVLKSGCVGLMSLERWMALWYHIGARVLLDGQDITSECRSFDDISGQAECFAHDLKGEFILGGLDNAVTEIRHGRIEVAIP